MKKKRAITQTWPMKMLPGMPSAGPQFGGERGKGFAAIAAIALATPWSSP
jgi:hypothetical protein